MDLGPKSRVSKLEVEVTERITSISLPHSKLEMKVLVECSPAVLTRNVTLSERAFCARWYLRIHSINHRCHHRAHASRLIARTQVPLSAAHGFFLSRQLCTFSFH